MVPTGKPTLFNPAVNVYLVLFRAGKGLSEIVKGDIWYSSLDTVPLRTLEQNRPTQYIPFFVQRFFEVNDQLLLPLPSGNHREIFLLHLGVL